jgi:hypothetical protein
VSRLHFGFGSLSGGLFSETRLLVRRVGVGKLMDVKFDQEKIEKEGAEYLSLFATKMRDLAAEIIGEIEVKTLPHIETDAWTNYREALRLELEREYKYSHFKKEWATEFRRAVFVENREEISKLISEDILKRIKHLEDCKQEYECFRYTPLGDTYQCLKKKLDQYIARYGEL